MPAALSFFAKTHHGSSRAPRTGTPLEQLEQDLVAFFAQAKTSIVAEDYVARRAKAAARYSGLLVSAPESQGEDSKEPFFVSPPTQEEKATLSFLQWVRSRDANLFINAPSLQPQPTLYERPHYVAAQQHYESRLLAYSRAWHLIEAKRHLPSPQLPLTPSAVVHNETQKGET